MAGEPQTTRAAWQELLEPLRAEPAQAAILTDFDGTLAPIVERAEDAALPGEAREVLVRLIDRYGAGRRGLRPARRRGARRWSALDGLAYAGNHGLELLLPGESEPSADPSLDGREREAAEFLAAVDAGRLDDVELRRRRQGADPGAPLARRRRRGAGRGGRPARSRSRPSRAGLEPRWGRKVLELRPVGGGGKDAAVASLLAGERARPRRLRGRRPHRRRRLPPARRAARGGRAGRRGPGRRPLRRGAGGDRRGVRRHRRRPGRLARDPRLAGGVARCPTPTCCASPSSSPAPRRPSLGAISAIAVGGEPSSTTVIVAVAWWAIAIIIGFWLGRPERARDDMRDAARQSPDGDLAAAPSRRPGSPSSASGRSPSPRSSPAASASSSPASRSSAPATP